MIAAMSDRCRRALERGGGATALAALALLAAGCAHTLQPSIPYQHQGVFDFREPPCRPASSVDGSGEDAVVLRYLGAGGLYVGWRGEALVLGPFFSNPGLLRVGLGRMRWDRAAIGRGLAGIPTERVGALIAGHSHYDHVGDLPVIAAERAADARILVNRSGANALAAFPELRDRISVLEESENRWLDLADAAGRPLPFRVLAVASDHAPHVGPIHLWQGESRRSCRPWECRRYGSLKEGRTFALVIDLLEPAAGGAARGGERAVRFRIYYQDSAASERAGLPPEPAAGDPPYDLAVLCAASAHRVEPAPVPLLDRISPAHVLVSHYENFFRPWGPGRGFVPLLTRSRLESFLQRVESAAGGDPAGPVGEVCGPSTRVWTIPLVGERVEFRPSHRTAVPGSEGGTR